MIKIGAFIFLALFFVSNFIQSEFRCHFYYDLGIYGEALKRISLSDLNPWIPGRAIHIFSDHFDPILIPVALIYQKLFFWIPVYLFGFICDLVALVSMWIPLTWLVKSKKLNMKHAALVFAALATGRAAFESISTPFHPTTWAAPFLLAVFVAYALADFKKLWWSLLGLYLCREEFPLLGLTAPVAILFHEGFRGIRIKAALSILALTAPWLVFIFFYRPLVLPGVVDYGGQVLKSFIEDPFLRVKDFLNYRNLLVWVEWLAPLILLSRWRDLKNRTVLAKVMGGLILGSSVLAIRFVSHAWMFHYGLAAVIVIWMAFYPIWAPSLGAQVKSRTLSVAAALIWLPLSLTMVKHHLPKANAACPYDLNRRDAIVQAEQWIKEHRDEFSKIIASGNLAPTILGEKSDPSTLLLDHVPDLKFATTSEKPTLYYFEKPPKGKPWPLSYAEPQSLISALSVGSGSSIVFNNEWVFLGFR